MRMRVPNERNRAKNRLYSENCGTTQDILSLPLSLSPCGNLGKFYQESCKWLREGRKHLPSLSETDIKNLSHM